MSQRKAAAPRDPSRSAFPLEGNWSAPRDIWHHSYPDDCPPALDFPPLRTEQLLLCAAGRYPDREAIRYFRTGWTYRELTERIQQVAANLFRLGVRSGDRVMTVLPNCPDMVVVWFATHWLGAEVVPGNPLLCAEELGDLIQRCRPKAVIGLDVRLKPIVDATKLSPVPLLVVSSLASHLPIHLRWPYRLKMRFDKTAAGACATQTIDFAELYESTAPRIGQPFETDASLPAVLQPTGGTTGTPKVAILTHANLQANVAQLHTWSGLQPGTEIVLSVLPIFHVFGATVAMLSPLAGGSTLLLQARFCPKRIFNVIERWKPNVAPMVPFMFASLVQEMERRGRSLTDVDYCFSGASSLPSRVREDFERLTGARIIEGYGLSEASPVTHSNPPDDTACSGTIGLPLPGTEARIVDIETGMQRVAPGEVGELIIRGPQVMQGYLDDFEETSRMLRNGWLHTGDLACRDEDGFFTIVDRKKDMIISAGLNVYPAEVEEVLVTHPTVADCAVIGTPDDLYGEIVTAYVVSSNGRPVEIADLERHCREHLARYKIPRIIEQCDELPKNFLGKTRRVDLRSRAA